MNYRRNPLSNTPLFLILIVALFASLAVTAEQVAAQSGRSCAAGIGVPLPSGCYFWPSQGACQGTGAHYCVKDRLVFNYPNESNAGGALFYAQVPNTYISCAGPDCPAVGTACSSSPLPEGERPTGKVVHMKNFIKCTNF
jgi:hypothetical protein